MAQKYELIRALYENTLQDISASQAAWHSFLRSACNNYKCRFDEQVLIYAQRPKATAVLEIERWNKQFGRWVNAGATGIAVFDRQADERSRLKHYFDISDTHENPRFAKPVPVWHMESQYHNEVIETLEASFGALKRGETLTNAIFSAVQNAVEDNHQEYLQQLLEVTDGSAFDGMDTDAVSFFFKEALAGSVDTMLLARCGEKISEVLPPERLAAMRNFNTPETLTLLGTATSDIAETMLREIARTVLSIQAREKIKIRTFANRNAVLYAEPIRKETPQSERSITHGTDIQNARRLSPAQLIAPANAGSGHREIRTDAQGIFGAAPQGNFHDSANERDAVRAFSGNQHNSQGTDVAIDTRDDAGAGRDGAAQGDRPNALGGAGEQHQERSGGNRAAGTDLPLTLQEPELREQNSQISITEKADSAELPAFLEETEIINTDTKPLRTPQAQVSFFDANFQVDTNGTGEQISMFKGFEISQQIIDEVLCLGSNDPKSKKRIVNYYRKDKPLVDNIRFLKQEYGTGGEGFTSGGHKVSVWYDEKGIRIAEGEHTEILRPTLVSWETATKRIKELLELGRYLPQTEIDAAPALERNEIADMLLYTWRDIDESAAALNLLSTIGTVYRSTSGFPDSRAGVAALLEQPEAVATIIEEYKAFSAAYENDHDIMRFRFHRPRYECLQRLLDLQREPRSFTAAEQIAPPIERFITRDELDAALRGSKDHHDSRLAVYSFFLNNRDPKVRAKYLKGLQIMSGYTWGPSGYVTKESKSFSMTRGSISQPYAKLVLSWSKVQQRIAQLIAQDKFLSEADYAAMPQYEKHEIARDVYFAFTDVPQEIPRPYPYGFDYYGAVPLIEQQLDDTVKTAELEQLLLPVLESTAPDDRYFEMRKEAAQTLSAYRNGTFSLFGKRGEKPDLSVPVQTLTPVEEKAETAKELAARLHEIYGELGAPTDTPSSLDDLVRDIQQPKARKQLLHTLHGYLKGIDPEEETAADIQMLLEDLQQFSEIEVSTVTPTQSLTEQPAPSKKVQDNPQKSPADLYHEYLPKMLDRFCGTLSYHYLRDVKPSRETGIEETKRQLKRMVANMEDVESRDFRDAYVQYPLFADWLVCDIYDRVPNFWTGIWEDSPDLVTLHAEDTDVLMWIHTGTPITVQTLTPAEEKAETAKELAARLHEIYGELGAPTDTPSALDDLVRDIQQPKARKRLLNTLHDYLKGIDPEEETAADIQMLLEDLQQFSEAPQEESPEIKALFADELTQEPPPPAPPDIAQAVQEQLAKVTDANGYTAFADDVEKLLRDKNGDGLVPIAAVTWLKRIIAFSDVELKEYANNYEAETLDTFPILQQSVSAALGEKSETAIPPPRKTNTRVLFEPLHPEIPKEQRHDFCITDPQLGVGTASEKYAANLSAIHTLQIIEAENRLATPDEQEILSRYVGWGGLANCFEETHHKYHELKSILTETEYAAARESTLTAFYTPPVVIEGIYKALAQMGFEKGNILDPACGVGNFLGMLPETMRDAKLYGVELDSISGRIARLLYQNGNVAVSGFEKTEMPDSFFDVAVGNVPFGDFKVLDRRYDKHKWLIHDYFFGKTLDKVRPGGIVAFVTSKGTMDKKNGAVRKYLAQRADLIGAIRLPNDTFKKNAGTEVTSDIIFLQKRDRMVDIEPDWVHLDTDENGIAMNAYFTQHPEMVLGEMTMVSGPFGMESTCKAYENADLSRLLDEALQNLHAEITEPELEDIGDTDEDLSIPADPSVRNFSYTVSDGKLYFRENSRMNPVTTTQTGEQRIRGMIALRDCARHLIELQTEDYPEADICDAQAKLNHLYDAYTKKYDILSGRGNEMAFGEDSSYPLLCSLEVLDDNGKFKEKAAMFTRRTIKPHIPVTSVDTASEALAVSISEKARIDMEYMAQLSGKDEVSLENDLTGVIFRNVKCATVSGDIPKSFVQKEHFSLVPSDEYLSGNVREKLAMARALYEVLPAEEKEWLAPNVIALEAVQPVDLTAGEISVRIGATWIPSAIYEQFMFELFGTGADAKKKMDIFLTKCTGEWHITNKNADHGNVKVFSSYGTLRASAYHILEKTLNLKDVRIFDTKLVNGNETRVLNKKETQIAQDKQEIISNAFKDWIWKDIDRREAMCKLYNETFNSIRPREYDGRHIKFPGMNPEYTMLPHQINAIARALYGGNTLLAHCVGAGKTFEMVAIAMESKRLGLCTKSLLTVPNHIIGQFAAEWLQLYPSANLLVATKKDFEAKNRKKFCARISTGDYDAVIIGHSQSERIPMSPERQEIILQQQIDEMSYGIDEARRAECPRYTVKQMEKSRKALETRLALLNNQDRKDNVVCFEELGVDRLFVDESHYFKNLFLVSKMRNVGGIAQTEAQKSSDLFMKCRYLDELTGGKGIVFATGTPISNSMVVRP